MTASERLTHALTSLANSDQHTPCQGRRSERWTSDDYGELEWAAFHCASMGCPLLELCGATADEQRTKHYVWGGTIRSPKPKRKAS
jgi:hypothetical protein